MAAGYSQDGQLPEDYDNPVTSDSVDTAVEDPSYGGEDAAELGLTEMSEDQDVQDPDIFDEDEDVDESNNSIISFNILYYLLQKFKFSNNFY